MIAIYMFFKGTLQESSDERMQVALVGYVPYFNPDANLVTDSHRRTHSKPLSTQYIALSYNNFPKTPYTYQALSIDQPAKAYHKHKI